MSKFGDSLMKAIEDLSNGYLGLDAFKNKNVYVNGILQEHVVYVFSDCAVVIQTDWKTGEFVPASPNDEDVWNGYALTRVKGTIVSEDKFVVVEKPIPIDYGFSNIPAGWPFNTSVGTTTSVKANPVVTTSGSSNIVLPWVSIIDS